MSSISNLLCGDYPVHYQDNKRFLLEIAKDMKDSFVTYLLSFTDTLNGSNPQKSVKMIIESYFAICQTAQEVLKTINKDLKKDPKANWKQIMFSLRDSPEVHELTQSLIQNLDGQMKSIMDEGSDLFPATNIVYGLVVLNLVDPWITPDFPHLGLTKDGKWSEKTLECSTVLKSKCTYGCYKNGNTATVIIPKIIVAESDASPGDRDFFDLKSVSSCVQEKYVCY